jgi:hypothetical protein
MDTLKYTLIQGLALLKYLSQICKNLTMLCKREFLYVFNRRAPKILLCGHNVQFFDTKLAVHKAIVRL